MGSTIYVLDEIGAATNDIPEGYNKDDHSFRVPKLAKGHCRWKEKANTMPHQFTIIQFIPCIADAAINQTLDLECAVREKSFRLLAVIFTACKCYSVVYHGWCW